MRIGLSLSSSLATDHPADGARFMVERARAGMRAGLDSLTVGDHHVRSSPYYQNTPMLGRLLADWTDRPAGCLFLLPLWHPVLVAEHIGTLAALVDAPFIVQTGIGHGEDQFRAMGADHATRGRVLEESVRVVKALLAGDDVDSDLVGGPVRLGLRPVQPVEWWIGGGPAPRAIERAARIGDAWYGAPSLDPSSAGDQLGLYLDACEQHGTVPRPTVRKDVLVLESPGAAPEAAAPLLAAGYRGLGPDQLLIGTPAEVAEQLQPFVELGFTDVICRCMSTDQSHAIESIELLGRVRELLG